MASIFVACGAAVHRYAPAHSSGIPAAPRVERETGSAAAESPAPARGATNESDRVRDGDRPSSASPGDDAAASAPPPARPRRRPPPSGMKAGAADDNVQFNAFLRFMKESRGLGLKFPAERRRIVQVRDKAGRPWPEARVTLIEGGKATAERRTYADGRTLLFPAGPHPEVRVTVPGVQRANVRPLGARRTIEITVPAKRPTVDRVPLDIAFILDTTGSMQDEIDQLRATLNTINFQISNASPRPAVRYGLVLFRDKGDEYRTRYVPFTADLARFSAALDEVSAGGGDDYPEDVQAGLEVALKSLEWSDRGVKLAFLIGDAPPHLDYGQTFTYLDAAQAAADRGIKIATIGASGLNRLGEVVWRQVAQQTMAPFVFLTYGEKGDAEGSPSSVSHHVGANWVADDLDAIVIRLVKSELAHWRPKGAPERKDYFIAKKSEVQSPDAVLEELFARSAQQLVDYAIESLEPRTPTVLLPLEAKDADQARGLERRLAVGLSRQGRFQLVEVAKRKKLLGTVASQMVRGYDESRMVEVGKMVPARLAVLGAVDGGDKGVELLVKLIRLETGEVLSLSLMRIDEKLL